MLAYATDAVGACQVSQLFTPNGVCYLICLITYY